MWVKKRLVGLTESRGMVSDLESGLGGGEEGMALSCLPISEGIPWGKGGRLMWFGGW